VILRADRSGRAEEAQVKHLWPCPRDQELLGWGDPVTQAMDLSADHLGRGANRIAFGRHEAEDARVRAQNSPAKGLLSATSRSCKQVDFVT